MFRAGEIFYIKYNQSVFLTISSWGPEDVFYKGFAFVLLILADRYSFSLLPPSSPERNRALGSQAHFLSHNPS